MKQKYLLEKLEDKSLVIREYGELEENIYSLLCEETFDYEGLVNVVENEKELVDFLRTDNMFPPFSYMVKIMEAVKGIYSEKNDENTAEIIFDEAAIAKKEREAEEEELYAEDELLDDILEGGEEDFDSIDDDLGDIDSSAKSIKVDEDSDLDVDI